jgi:SOS-response transcriptional repressor LexA
VKTIVSIANPRQRRILRVIHDFQAVHRYPPTVRQLVAALGLSSPGSMAWHLRRMREQGLMAERTSDRECWQILVDLPIIGRLKG